VTSLNKKENGWRSIEFFLNLNINVSKRSSKNLKKALIILKEVKEKE